MHCLTRRSRSATIWSAVAGVACSLLLSGAAHAVTTSEFVLSGLVNNPGTFNIDGSNGLRSLQALPSVTQTDNYTAAGTPTTTTFTGVPLYTLLTDPLGGGGIVVTPGVKNDFLGDAIVETGSDGYRSVVSEGEIDPGFGAKPDLVAYQNAPGVPLGSDGFARTTAPGDLAGGRYVSNVASISLFSGSAASQIQGTGGGLSSSFALAGQVNNPGSFDLAALAALPQTSVTVAGGTYSGVSLWTFLQSAGIITNPLVKNDILGKYLVATGSDGYKAVISLGEISPSFGNQQDLIATGLNGGGLGTNGFARLVIPGDIKAGRYVSNLIGLEVLPAPVPVPASVWLFGSGLVALVGIARRKIQSKSV